MCKSVYIHVPFCRNICSYCDFTRCRYHAGLAQQWLSTIIEEIHSRLHGRQMGTVYIGGGTPTALSYIQLQALLSALAPYSQNSSEYTIEANLDSLTKDKIELCTTFGVNRISLGIQTLQPSLLKLIHRQHTKADVIAGLHMIHTCGIQNISIDLIYGLPMQTMAMWKQDLAFIAAQTSIQHISLYALTIEKNSLFGRQQIKNIDPDVEADMYEYALMYLEAHGFHRYEISNFARGDHTSKHNQVYWQYMNFIGIGMGASGKENHQRYDNTRNMHTYITQGAKPTFIPLALHEERFEYIMMGLRMCKGIDTKRYEELYQISIFDEYPNSLKKYMQLRLLIYEHDHLQTSAKGMLLLNDILVDMLKENESNT